MPAWKMIGLSPFRAFALPGGTVDNATVVGVAIGSATAGSSSVAVGALNAGLGLGSALGAGGCSGRGGSGDESGRDVTGVLLLPDAVRGFEPLHVRGPRAHPCCCPPPIPPRRR